MNTRLLCLLLSSGIWLATQPLSALDAPPAGLSAGDWASIREAYEAGRHEFFTHGDGSFVARNPGQNWVTRFDEKGFTTSPFGGGWEWGLELNQLSFGTKDSALRGDASGVLRGRNRLSFQRGAFLEEWFVNDTRGLEQGWTITRRPESAGSGPLTLGLGIRGTLKPKVTDGTVEFHDAGGLVLTYGGLKAWDANGKTLGARFVAAGKGFSLEVDDAQAVYPVTIDPLAQQAYVKASNAKDTDRFGWSVAVSGDTVVVSAVYESSSSPGVNGNQDNESLPDAGAAYVFVRQGNRWFQQAYLKASNPGETDEFGYSVAISGNTIVVSAPREDSKGTGVNGSQVDQIPQSENTGAAYVFVRTGWVWSQQAYLKASNPAANTFFGDSVAISGNTIAVGCSSAGLSGAVYVFHRVATTWTQQAYLQSANGDSSDLFGASVALSGDTLVAGAYGEQSNTSGVNSTPNNDLNGAGAAYVFQRTGTIWTQQAYLKASNPGLEDYFGLSVAISGDTIVVGAYAEDSDSNLVDTGQTNEDAENAGAAYVFERTGGQWRQTAYLKANNSEAHDWFGRGVAVSEATIAVSAYQEDGGATGFDGADSNSKDKSGAVYLYTKTGGQWALRSYVKAADSEIFDLFGYSVALSGDLLVVGAPEEDGGSTGVNGTPGLPLFASNSGAAYIFTGMSTVHPSLAKLGASAPGAEDIAFGAPGMAAVGDNNTHVIFEAGLTGSGAPLGRNRGMFARDTTTTELLLQARDGLGGFGGGFTPDQFALSLFNPCANQASFGRLFQVAASGPLVTTSNNRALLRDTGSFLTLVRRTGQAVTELSDAQPSFFFEVLQSCDTDLLAIPVALKLQASAPSVALTNDSALLPLDHAGTVQATSPAREGGSAEIYTGTPGDLLGQLTGRASLRAGNTIHFSAPLIQPPSTPVAALYRVDKNGMAGTLTAKGGTAPVGLPPGTLFSSFPGLSDNGSNPVFRAFVTGQPSAKNEGIWSGTTLILQKGTEFDSTNYNDLIVTRILRYWPVAGDQVVLHALLAGPGVTLANNNALLLRQANGEYLVLLRTGEVAPGCLFSSVKVASIVSVEVDPQEGHYAVLGSLSGTSARSNLALWTGWTLFPGSDDTAQKHLRRPVLRLRKGDAYSSEATPRDIIRSIALRTAPDPTGAGGRGLGRAVSPTGMVAVTLTGDRGIQELITVKR